MKKLIVIDSGNVMHKAIFAIIAQLHAKMKKMANENNISDFDVSNFDHIWERFYNEIQDEVKNKQFYLMYGPATYLLMVIGYLKKIGITFEDTIILAMDYGSWRKDIDTEYKRQRAAMRDEKMPKWWWKEQYNTFNEFFDKFNNYSNWHQIKIYKMEADDVASVAIRKIDADEKIMISSDEDWQQLCVIPNTKVFSPYSKKYKIVKDPESILLKKIYKGDISDNLLTVPQTEKEFAKRKLIVDLLHLPQHIEEPIKQALIDLPMKNLYVNKVPFRRAREGLKKLYKL